MKHIERIKAYIAQSLSNNTHEEHKPITIGYEANCLKTPYLRFNCFKVQPMDRMESSKNSILNIKITYVEDSEHLSQIQKTDCRIKSILENATDAVQEVQGILDISSNIKYSEQIISIEYECKIFC